MNREAATLRIYPIYSHSACVCALHREKKTTVYPAAMGCLANITQALGEAVSPYIDRVLEPLFSIGLSEQVTLFIPHLCIPTRLLPGHFLAGSISKPKI